MARTGLSDLRSTLRQLAEAGTADFSINGTAYFTDDQLDTILDLYRKDIVFFEMEAIPYKTASEIVYNEYKIHYRDLEQTTGGTAIFYVQDASGNVQGTASYSVDYSRGIVTFETDTDGVAYFITARSYDLRGAAAEVWLRKGSVSGFSVEYQKHCLKLSESFKDNSDMAVATLDLKRDDTDV